MCESQSLSPSLKAKEFISLSGRESWKAVERTAVTVFEVERALLTHASLTLTVALGKNKDKPKSLLVTYWLFHCCASTKTPVSFPYCQDSHLVCPRLRFWRFSWQPDLYNALYILKKKKEDNIFFPLWFFFLFFNEESSLRGCHVTVRLRLFEVHYERQCHSHWKHKPLRCKAGGVFMVFALFAFVNHKIR